MRNQILITVDSLRYDVFEKANCTWLKSHKYYKAYTHGSFTLPSHTAMFAGKLPTTFKGEFDYAAKPLRSPEGKAPWRLITPGMTRQQVGLINDQYIIRGKNIVDGFKRMGWNTIGAGAVTWFNNAESGSYVAAVDDFEHYVYSGYTGGIRSAKYAIDTFDKERNNFIFINFGETHYPFRIYGEDEPVEYGDFDECFNAQKKAFEVVEKYIRAVYNKLDTFDMYIMSDHGECFGENDLWGHSFFHPKVIEVPIMRISK